MAPTNYTVPERRTTCAESGLDQLVYACQYHSDGLTEADTTVQTCWDADRLDLGRVGIKPNPSRLCTIAASDPAFLRAAYDRSRRRM